MNQYAIVSDRRSPYVRKYVKVFDSKAVVSLSFPTCAKLCPGSVCIVTTRLCEEKMVALMTLGVFTRVTRVPSSPEEFKAMFNRERT